MDDAWKKSAADPRFRIVSEPAGTPRVPSWVHDDEILRALGPEFADGADLPPDEPTRRHFLSIMGASAALASVSGCFNQPQEKIVPYVRPPEQIIPGKPLYYATAMTLAGASMGLLVETHMGRPVKVEGNPLHPAVPETMAAANRNLPASAIRFGATDAFSQAIVLSLYDPDRSQTILREGQIDTWETLYTELRGVIEQLAPNGGQGLRILTGNVTSPSTLEQLQQLLTQYPNAHWHQYEPINDDNAVAGSRMAFGEAMSATYVGQPEVVLSLDADCLADGPQHLLLARMIRGASVASTDSVLPRLYVVETSSTITGAAADHRLPLGPSGVVRFALQVARGLGLQIEDVYGEGEEAPAAFVEAVVGDLQAANGRSLIIAGRGQPPVVHAIAHWINATLGNVGQTLEYRTLGAEQAVLNGESIRELVRAMQAKEVPALLIVGGNPAFDAPADVPFSAAIKDVPFTLHLSEYVDETSAMCKWHVPKAHIFEAWDDTVASDGAASIVQPLIAPMYDGKTCSDLLGAVLGNPMASSHDTVRAYWQQRLGFSEGDTPFNAVWEKALNDGIVPNSAAEAQVAALSGDFAQRASESLQQLAEVLAENKWWIIYRPDASLWDGRFANNAWLQELPRPFTKLTWDNAALMSPQSAGELRVKTGDLVEIDVNGTKTSIAVLIVPGHPRQTVSLHLGYGREKAGRVGNGVGTNVYPLRATGAMWFAPITSMQKSGGSHEFAVTQHHHHMEGRDLVRSGTLAEFLQSPEHPHFMEVGHGHSGELTSLYPEPKYEGYKWGMVINQSACVGCNGCVVACQAENNIPTVGKDQVWRGREMHWLRIDSYYEGESANPTVLHQPVLCQHCELAPCEPVCPVAATTHSDEGLNEMTYNRCVGTRYCSNNCPYKVRRFNFYDFNAELREEPLMQLRPNPDVTVRSRGVMEKCTYCVQRINAGRIGADVENRQIRDGEVITACQAACPTQAIVFGDLNDPNSAVSKLAASSLNYSLLGDLNTRPRTTYLAVVRNPNPSVNDG
jgi:Fe-S-cluster-containing dehydrogenase component